MEQSKEFVESIRELDPVDRSAAIRSVYEDINLNDDFAAWFALSPIAANVVAGGGIAVMMVAAVTGTGEAVMPDLDGDSA